MRDTTTGKTAVHVSRERAVAVDVAVHSAAMEGLAATRADADEYAVGTIDVDEQIGRVDARHRVG